MNGLMELFEHFFSFTTKIWLFKIPYGDIPYGDIPYGGILYGNIPYIPYGGIPYGGIIYGDIPLYVLWSDNSFIF